MAPRLRNCWRTPVFFEGARRIRGAHAVRNGVLGCLLSACLPLALGEQSAGRPGMDVGSVLGGQAVEGFRVAEHARPFSFPDDHAPHPAFRSEWWYLTAHLEDDGGRPIGVQFTLFRQALAPPQALADEADSAWRTEQVWMAHLAIGAESTGHLASERFARGALGLAGAQGAPFAAWLDDWRLESIGPDFFPLRLTASLGRGEGGADAPAVTLDLEFVSERAPVPQGENGLSRKSERAGNASHYYSLTRLDGRGAVTIDGRKQSISGLGWLDREWSTSALDPGQTGWDWFALHLDDGRDLMVYRIRRDDGSVDAASAGVIVDGAGGRRVLARDDWVLEPLEFWQDERAGRWPVTWRLAIPGEEIAGVVRAVIPDSLNRLAVRYWEGMVCLDGAASGLVGGCGYLELTGYNDG